MSGRSILLTIALLCLNTRAEDTQNSNVGLITSAIENLAQNTASITEEISKQLSTQLAQTSDLLLGNMETVVGKALDQLAAPILQAQNQLSKCQPSMALDSLYARIDMQLRNCTQDLTAIREAFQSDSIAIASTIQSYIREIANLPRFCQLLGTPMWDLSLASGTNCFVQRMTVINRSIGKELSSASMALRRTRQLSEQSVTNAEQCASEVVADMVHFLDTALRNC